MGPTVWSGVTFLALIVGLSTIALLAFRGRWTSALVGVLRWGGLGFTLLALGFMAAEYLRAHDWVHLLWNSTFPQLVLFLGGGAFLLRGRGGGGAWAGVLLVCFVALALAPGVLLQLEPRPDAHPRNVGRPLAGLLEVIAYGLGGPLPDTLVPQNAAGLARGMGYLPREVSVPVGAVANAGLLGLLLALVAIGGVWIERQRIRDVFHLIAPFALLPLTIRPLPLGIQESSVWDNAPLLLRGLGPLLTLSALATVVAAVLQRRAARGLSGAHPARDAPVR